MSDQHDQQADQRRDQQDGDAITIFCVMRPRPEAATTLRNALTTLVEPTRAEAGCIAYDLYEADDGVVVLFETWRTPDELTAHQAQPAVRTLFGDRIDNLLAEPMAAHFTHPLRLA
jgi:quinol monooxygenase YgiN